MSSRWGNGGSSQLSDSCRRKHFCFLCIYASSVSHTHTHYKNMPCFGSCSVDNDLSAGSPAGPHQTADRLEGLCAVDSHISNSVTFRWGVRVGGRGGQRWWRWGQKCLFFSYLESLRRAHCSARVQFPCGKHSGSQGLTRSCKPPTPLHLSLESSHNAPCLGWLDAFPFEQQRRRQQHRNVPLHLGELTAVCRRVS